MVRHGLLMALMLGVVPALPVQAQDEPEAPAGPVLTRAPELLTFVEAEYPPEAQAAGVEASVLLELVIGADGLVTEALVVESPDVAFGDAALAAVRQFVFSPAEIDGVPALIRIRYQYDFVLTVDELPPPPSELVGQVLDLQTGEPLADITVTVGTVQVVTDAEGGFVVGDLEPGTLDISLEGASIAPVFGQETIGEGERLEVVWQVDVVPAEPLEDGVLMEIVVRAPRSRSDAVSTRMNAEQARSVPGTSGDVVRVVENMPGVARAGAGQGNLVVWGAAPEDTRVYLDGVPLPRLYHESGVRAVIHPQFVESVSLVPGGWGASYGRGLGGIVLVDTATPLETGTQGTVGVDVYDASAAVVTRTERGVHAGVSGRYGLIRPLATAIDESTGEFVALPSYWDGQARVGYEGSGDTAVQLAFLGSGDRVQRGVPNPDPALQTSERRAIDVGRMYVQVRIDRPDDEHIQITPWVGIDAQERESRYGAVVTRERSAGWSAGLRLSHARRLAPWVELEYGLDAEFNRLRNTRQGSLALPPREGDARVFGQPPPDELSQDSWITSAVGVAPFAEGRFQFFDGRLRVTPGLRVDPYARSTSRRIPVTATIPEVGLFKSELRAEPRLAVEGRPLSWLSLRAATGVYHQAPNPLDVSPVFGNPDLEIARGRHFLAGAAVTMPWDFSLEVTGFMSQTADLAFRNPADSPPTAQALLATGEGRARGLQILARREMTGGVFGWVAYTLSVAERRANDTANWRPFDFDQTHVLTAVAGWQPTSAWDLSLRFRYATGTPRTPVDGATYDVTRDRWEPTFGDVNSIRLPAFVQLDVRVARTFETRAGKWLVFFEVLNATAQENAEEFVFNADYSERGIISGLPILPVAGAQWTF